MTKYSVGDRVEVTITGDVISVSTEPNDKHEYLRLDNYVFLWTGSENVNIRKLAPPKPEVGEVITGARLKATPWKRGTVIVASGGYGFAYLLDHEGYWHSTYDRYAFAAFDDIEYVKVVYLP